jgi:hypothetical protein
VAHGLRFRTWTGAGYKKQLQTFDELALRYEATVRPGDYIGDRTLYDELHRAEPVVRRILEAIDPAIAAKVDIDQFAGVVMARNEIQRGLGLLADMYELSARLALDAPALIADRLHPWVWEAARTFWDSSHLLAAIHAASAAINAHTQDKVGRCDVADDKLIQECFSPSVPDIGRPRLRVLGDASDQTKCQKRLAGW